MKRTTFGPGRTTTFCKPNFNQKDGLGMKTIDSLYSAVGAAQEALFEEKVDVEGLSVSQELYSALETEYQSMGFDGVPDKFCGLPLSLNDKLEGRRYEIDVSQTTEV